jgi:hypothetical protein
MFNNVKECNFEEKIKRMEMELLKKMVKKKCIGEIW